MTGPLASADRGGFAVGTVGAMHLYQRRLASGDAVRLDVRPGLVAGREELIGGLRQRLVAGQGVGTVALCGLGGVGKTTVALEYAHRFIDAYQVVWHFHAEQATDLLSQFHELARVLDAGDGDPVSAVHAALAAHPGPWLLVLDNLRDHATARQWLPPKGNGHVLITTQDGHWPAAQAVEVGTLSLAAATRFLLDRTGSVDVAAAEAVAAALGLLPLALAQAAAYVETTGRSLAGYREMLTSDRAAVLARGAPTAHATPVVATWSLALRELGDGSPGSVALLRLASFLAPEDIPFRLLLEGRVDALPAGLDAAVAVAPLCSGGIALDDAVAGLRRHSLIGPPSDTFTVHRLVQDVTRDRLDPAGQAGWRAAAAALVEAAVPPDPEVRQAWPACRLLLPHAELVADPIGVPIWRLAGFLGASGDYATARDTWRWLAGAHAAGLGPEHPETLTARHNLATWTGEAGDAAGARDLLAGLLPVGERVSGPEHPETLTLRHNFASWTGEAGDAAGARDLLAGLLPVRERVSGPEHPHTLTARHNLARWTGEAGDAAGARDLFAQLLPVGERVFGPEHPDTLTARHNLAHWRGEAGDAAGARDLYAQLLPLRERVFGPEHPRTLRTRHSLAHWRGEAGDAAGARDLLARLLPVRERVLGPAHPDTLVTRDSLAHWARRTEA